MNGEPLTVRPEVLREVARAFGDEAHRLARGLADAPALVVSAPGWRTAAALAGLESAVHAWCGALGARVAATGRALATAADGYQAADDRAARRLAGLPR
jgi:hypothetical protein